MIMHVHDMDVDLDVDGDDEMIVNGNCVRHKKCMKFVTGCGATTAIIVWFVCFYELCRKNLLSCAKRI